MCKCLRTYLSHTPTTSSWGSTRPLKTFDCTDIARTQGSVGINLVPPQENVVNGCYELNVRSPMRRVRSRQEALGPTPRRQMCQTLSTSFGTIAARKQSHEAGMAKKWISVTQVSVILDCRLDLSLRVFSSAKR